MNIKDVLDQVSQIEQEKSDPETAHLLEDSLYESVLRYIASGQCPNPEKFAKEALNAEKIDFVHWYS